MFAVGRAGQAVRRFTTSAVRRCEHDYGGEPGANLPFSTTNRFALTLKMALFFGSGAAIPFLTVRHQLLSKR